MPVLDNVRHEKFAVGVASGKTQTDAAIAAGYEEKWSRSASSRLSANVNIAARIQELLAELSKSSLIDAAEVHKYLTDCLRADMRDIRNDDGSFKPQSEWPAIWGRMMEAGDCEVDSIWVRSHDGATKDKAGGWDDTGRRVTKVKLKFASRTKFLELVMRHKAVDALVNPTDKLGEGLTDLASSIDRAIAEGRQRASKRNRVIDVTAKESK